MVWLVCCCWLRLARVGVEAHQSKGLPGGGVGQARLLQRLESLDSTCKQERGARVTRARRGRAA